jgi:hypothetical protein
MLLLLLLYRTLWNFSPRNFIGDSSGMYWRERRVRPGLYTDGETVYEATYRYRDGRNGMRYRSNLAQWLGSRSVDENLKEKLVKRMEEKVPDLVLEE